MRRYLWLLAVVNTACCMTGAAGEPTRHLLLDDRIVARTENAVLRLGHVEKCSANPLLSEEHPWEARFDNLYPTVIFDSQENVYKLWYGTFTRDAVRPDGSSVPREMRKPGTYFVHGRKHGIGYAISKDGIHWTKPMMDAVPWDGKPSNLVIEEVDGGGIIKDLHEQEASRRYKMLGKWTSQPSSNGLAVAFSSDGIQWSKLIHCPEAEAYADTHNNAFWSPDVGKYVGITRLWSTDKLGQRLVGRTESDDFVHWSKAVEVLRGTPDHQVYSMPVFQYGGVYLGLPTILCTSEDRTHVELAWSPDTIHWRRIEAGTPLIPNAPNKGAYDWGTIYASIPLFLKDDIRIYYGGGNGPHEDWRDGSLCLGSLRPDGFAGFEPLDRTKPAIVETNTITFGPELKITADAQKGSVVVMAVDEEGKTLLTSVPITADVTDMPVSWANAVDPSLFAGRKGRLRIEIKDAKVYSFVSIIP